MFQEFVGTLNEYLTNSRTSNSIEKHEFFQSICSGYIRNERSLENLLDGFMARLSNGPASQLGKSLKHENNFTKISLCKFDSGEQVRLHVWPKGTVEDSRIHNHRWWLSSFVAKGQLDCINYHLDFDASDGKENIVELLDEKDGVKKTAHAGRAVVEMLSAYSINAGCGHFVHQDILHRVRKPAGGAAVTIMLSGNPVKNSSLTVEAHRYSPGQREFLDQDSIVDTIREVFA